MEIPSLTINYSDPKQKEQLINQFEKVILKKQWDYAELMIKQVRDSKTNPEFANQLHSVLKVSREYTQTPSGRLIQKPEFQQSNRDQLLSDFEIALQSQEWEHAKDIINIVDRTVDKKLAQQLTKEYNDFYNVIKASKP